MRPLKGWRILRILFLFLVSLLILAKSSLPPADQMERIRAFTRTLEFDYVNWTLNALLMKNQLLAISPQKYMGVSEQKNVIKTYFNQVDEINTLQAEIDRIFSDPNIPNPAQSAAGFSTQLNQLEKENKNLAEITESILQQQISAIAADLNLGIAGQLIPPMLYHVTPLPMALIVSPRSVISQDADISLLPEMGTEEIVDLEKQVEENLNVSALVVPIGGVGIYPTMVMRSTNLSWMIEVIAHEWVHNFLTLRPLGMLYYDNPQMRTINETTANLAGKEIALAVYEKFYPQFIPQASPQTAQPPAEPSQTPIFDFRSEMHTTRITVDAMLAERKIDQAEEYMESRRIFFWQNGYHIRKLNQAYFAFYGAYADVSGGEAGADPVGPAVRALRAQSDSLAQFLNRISWMTSFEILQQAVR